MAAFAYLPINAAASFARCLSNQLHIRASRRRSVSVTPPPRRHPTTSPSSLLPPPSTRAQAPPVPVNDAAAATAPTGGASMGGGDCADVLLVDMDNTVVDYDGEFAKRWRAARPQDDGAAIANRRFFEMEKNFPPELQSLAVSIISDATLFESLRPYPGAVAALRALRDAGIAVRLCTSPSLFQYEQSAAAKYAWVRRFLGEDWLSSVVITRDKTVIRGAVLVDDKPAIKGACDAPEWTQVLFRQPYNHNVEGLQVISSWTGTEWRKVLAPMYPQLSRL